MLSFLPANVRAVITFTVMLINTVAMCTPLFIITFARVLLPVAAWQRLTAHWLVRIAETWVLINNFAISLPNKVTWDVQGTDKLNYSGWYLVTCNHQSWVDILVLQKMFTRKAPFLKFFLKKELIWVPMLGIAWWALDFPFMKRYTKDFLQKNPHMKGKDLETTQKACEKFKLIPVSVMNFLEGTRFTQAKHDRQQSPYEHLLKPKSGGIAFVLAAMGGQLHSMLDVTIVYDRETVGFWDLMKGRVSRVTVRVTERHIPDEFATGDYENDAAFRGRFQSWVNQVWEEKDQLMGELKKEISTSV